jgi:hypothetical protein
MKDEHGKKLRRSSGERDRGFVTRWPTKGGTSRKEEDLTIT